MKRSPSFAAALLLVAACTPDAGGPTQPRVPAPTGRPNAETESSDLLTYHGGFVIRHIKVVVIYWANRVLYSGGPTPGTWGTGDQDGSLVGYFLNHLSGSPYYNINTLYYSDFEGKIADSVTYLGFVAADWHVPPPGSEIHDHDVLLPDDDDDLQPLVNDNRVQIHFPADGRTLYLVLVDSGVILHASNGSTSVCGWHTHEALGPSIYGPIKYKGGPCSISASYSPNADTTADQVVGVIAHEVVETSSDPTFRGLSGPNLGWYVDDSGAVKGETADVCGGSTRQAYPSTAMNPNGLANVHLGDKDFLLPANWVNRADFVSPVTGHCFARVYTIEGPVGAGYDSSTIATPGTNTWTVQPVIAGNTFQWQYTLDGANWTDFPSATGSTLSLSRDAGGPTIQENLRVVVTTGLSYDTAFKTPPFYVSWTDPPPLVVDLAGPTMMGPSDACWWFATASNGTPPYTYSWQNGLFVETTSDTSRLSSTGPVHITVSVTDAVGGQTDASMDAQVDEGVTGCH